MRPLQLVNPNNLQTGKIYLIQEKRPEYAYLKYKGTFIKNNYSQYQCIITHFRNVIVVGNKSVGDMHLHEFYWNYYEADAIECSYMRKILYEITGEIM